MSAESFYLLAANAILIFHSLFVVFVVLGLALIYLGKWLSWSWARNYWFRLVHLAAIIFVVVQSWVGVICPLTTWEMQLRELAGGEIYKGSFIQHWLQILLYYEAPEWAFMVVYTLFGGLVFASWFIVAPKRQ